MRWLVGDVHGMLRPLETLLGEISKVDPEAVIYFVGDYVNRGHNTRGVINLLLSLDNAKFIRGNHDDVLDQILHGKAYAENASRGDRFIAFQWFLEHGLLETLQSYGIKHEQIARVVSQRTRDSLEAIIDAIPVEHRMFIRSLPVFIEDHDLFVIHGKWPLNERSSPRDLLGSAVPIPQIRHEILWGRFTDADLHRRKAWPKPGFFGHTPVATYRGHEQDTHPLISAKMILLDTAAALSPMGRLTAMCAETSEIVQADPTGKLLMPQRDAKTA
jgi:serine/threonine protein phosphatase 1